MRVSIFIGSDGDLSKADLDRLVQVVADANAAADCRDAQLQHIETTLELASMAVEKKPSSYLQDLGRRMDEAERQS